MLRKEREGDILILRLDRPEKLNAWDRGIRDMVATTLNEAGRDPAMKAVVFTGTGHKAFCAGADLSDKTIGDASAAEDRMIAFRRLYDSILSFPKPLVAAFNGMALGSAFQAALLMDYRVAHREVQVGLPELSSGIPCITGAALFVWAAGALPARNAALTGRMIAAEEALRLGLVDEIVEHDEVRGRALAVATALAAKSPAAYAETKLWFRDMLRPVLDAAFARAAEVRSRSEMSQSITSGVAGFFGRRERSGTT